jgi:hypothetical protein
MTHPHFSLLRDGPPGANLFVYGIPCDWSEVTFMRLCQKFGHIVGIRVPCTVGWFAFVKFIETMKLTKIIYYVLFFMI